MSSTSSLVILASSWFTLQAPTLFLKHAHHPSSTHALTMSLYSPLPSERLSPSVPTSPLGPMSSFSPSVLHHTLLSPVLSHHCSDHLISKSKMLHHCTSRCTENNQCTTGDTWVSIVGAVGKISDFRSQGS